MELQCFFIAGGLRFQGSDTEVLKLSQSGAKRIQRCNKKLAGGWEGEAFY